MRILFLNPPHLTGDIYMKEIGRCGRRAVAGEVWPQTGLAYLAAVALQTNSEARIIDAMALSYSLEKLLEEISLFKPDLIVTNTTTPTFDNDVIVFTEIRNKIPDVILSFTGTHISALPEESLRKSNADFIFLNEAEETLKDILIKTKEYFKDTGNKNSTASNFKNFFLDEIRDVSGIAYLIEDKFYQTSARPFIDPLDSLPFPARHLLPNEKYIMPFFENKPFVTIIPTRGCPWRCIFCRAGKVWGNKVRTRSIENVLDEIEQIIRDLKIRNVAFMTDSFTLNRKWTLRFLEGILQRNIKFKWVCNSRVDAADIEMLELMKKAGCRLISYGVESGDQEILDRAKKGIKLESSARAIEMTRKAGIISMAYFILGLPGETTETIKRSIEFAKKINPDYANFHIATPFPGTELYEIASRNNWLVSDKWCDYEEEGSAVLRTESLTAEDLMKAQRMAMRKFYLRPSKLFFEVFSLRSPSQFFSHIKAGLKIFSALFKK